MRVDVFLLFMLPRPFSGELVVSTCQTLELIHLHPETLFISLNGIKTSTICYIIVYGTLNLLTCETVITNQF